MSNIRSKFSFVLVLALLVFGIAGPTFGETVVEAVESVDTVEGAKTVAVESMKAKVAKRVKARVKSSVNINTADASELAAALYNVGPKKAARIVKYRKLHGHFVNKEQLMNVKGIGKSTLMQSKVKIVF